VYGAPVGPLPTLTHVHVYPPRAYIHRAVVVHARVARGHNILITGIGGGVALLAMQLCLAHGARVYVTSGSDEKLAHAVTLGATGGVNYTHSQSTLFPPLLSSCMW
jgi:NADPH:quinone reductase-like Zn-dependent oxidoreductase